MIRLFALIGLLLVCLLSTATVQAAANPAPSDKVLTLDTDPHLVGWWKFDETTGTSAADSAKPGHPGALEGGLSFDTRSVAGRIGQAIKFEGNNEAVRITGYKGVTGAGPRTVALWLKTKESSGDLVTWGTNDAGKMFIFGHIRGRIGVTPKSGYRYMNADVNDAVWHHVAVVIREGSPPNLHDHVQVFKDGEPMEPDGIGMLDLLPFETGDQLDVCIGRRFKGAIDDLRIYDRALTEDEIHVLSQPAN